MWVLPFLPQLLVLFSQVAWNDMFSRLLSLWCAPWLAWDSWSLRCNCCDVSGGPAGMRLGQWWYAPPCCAVHFFLKFTNWSKTPCVCVCALGCHWVLQLVHSRKQKLKPQSSVLCCPIQPGACGSCWGMSKSWLPWGLALLGWAWHIGTLHRGRALFWILKGLESWQAKKSRQQKHAILADLSQER